MTEPRAQAQARALVAYLRSALEAPTLDLAEPPAVLRGGFDTEIYALRLRDAPTDFARPLVLRVLQPHHDLARALREQATQNAVADAGYPAPRVLLAAADPAALGAPFLLMERVPGRPLLEARAIGMGAVLADLQLRGTRSIPRRSPARSARRGRSTAISTHSPAASRARLDGLAPLLDWLRAGHPPGGALAICHGDFHPQNVLVERGVVTGVLDWPNALVADPAFDVASTLNILRFVPAGLTSMPRALRGLARLVQPLLARRYLARYRRGQPIDDARLAYYQVAAALRALMRAGESRRGIGGAPSGLDASPYAARLLEHARRVSGVAATLPS